MLCPFCHSEKNDLAAVCASCGRDTAVPEALLVERTELMEKRNRLRAELERAEARLAARRARFTRSRPA